MEIIRVLLATPHSLAATRLKSSLRAYPDMSVIGHAEDLTGTFHLAERDNPNIVIIDPDLTISPEFEVMLDLFRSKNIRWISIESDTSRRQIRRGKDLTRSGLFSISPTLPPDNLAQHIRTIAQRCRRPSSDPIARAAATVGEFRKLILIGSSTGGVEALLQILSEFPKNCPPTAIVQHTGASFTESLVKLLNRSCSAEVMIASDGTEIRSGMICVANPRLGHLGVHSNMPFRCKVMGAAPVSGHIPSVDVLFESSVKLARNTVGVLLTGMGKDGANGLLEMRNNGAITIAQDKATSVVYGMPRAAFEIGAVEHSLPLNKIASKILETASSRPNVMRSL